MEVKTLATIVVALAGGIATVGAAAVVLSEWLPHPLFDSDIPALRSEWVEATDPVMREAITAQKLAGSAQLTAEQAYRMAIENARQNNDRAVLENWQAQDAYRQQGQSVPKPLLDLQLRLEAERRALEQAAKDSLQ